VTGLFGGISTDKIRRFSLKNQVTHEQTPKSLYESWQRGGVLIRDMNVEAATLNPTERNEVLSPH
jgi:hypothetical protein